MFHESFNSQHRRWFRRDLCDRIAFFLVHYERPEDASRPWGAGPKLLVESDGSAVTICVELNPIYNLVGTGCKRPFHASTIYSF